MNVGINSMTNIDGNLALSSQSIPGSLAGVTDDKLSTGGGTSGGVQLTTGKVIAEQGFFSGEMNVGYWLYTDKIDPLFSGFTSIGQINSTKDLLYMREGDVTGLTGSELSGLAIKNADGAGNIYLVGVDVDGILKVGWSGSTLQPVSTGGGAITTYSVTNLTTVTTESATDVLMTGIQITDVPVGDYFLSFGATFEHSATGDQIYTNIYVGGTAVTGSEQHWRRGGSQGNISSTHNYSGFPITLATTATVEIRWRTDGATASAENPYMTLIKV